MPQLTCHPDSPCEAIASIDADITCSSDSCLLQYQVYGDIASLKLPEARPAAMMDGLWQHTCFELFIGAKHSAAYYEYNFSPSSEWAMYSFTDYRMPDSHPMSANLPPVIQSQTKPDQFILQVNLPKSDCLLIAREKPWSINLSAVIELQSGDISYWALHHPSRQPDFHHKNGFTYEIWS